MHLICYKIVLALFCERVLILKLYATEISDYFDLFHSFPDYF